MRTASLLIALSLTLTACDNPFKSDGSAAPGESSPAEDAVAISNYIYEVSIRGDGNQVIIGQDNRSQVDNSTQPAPEPAPEEPAAEEPVTEEPAPEI
jgi:hypothetical protein